MHMVLFDFNQVSTVVSTLLAIIAALVVLTNIITQVIKQVYTAEGVPAQIVVAVVAIALTVVTMVVVLIVLKQVVFWYYYPVAIIVGLMVAYGAMFGYDNLYHEIAKVIGNTNKEDKKE